MSVVAIVGRQNVGKSTLFNKLIGKRQALVSDMPGVTRDRHYGSAFWTGFEFTLIDTGGLSFDESDRVEAQVHKQSLIAVDEADVVICLFDGPDGLTSMDREIVDIFRKNGKAMVCAVNKIDSAKGEELAAEFSELGVDIVPISAEHSRNLDLLLDKVVKLLPPAEPLKKKTDGLRIALVGRPNVGKSTIINRLSSKERVVVHELPGTTRDTIDVEIDFEGKKYIFVDTAGVKKRAKTREKIDKFSTLKSLRAIDDADVVFAVIDAVEGVSHQDLTLIAHAFDSNKVTAVLVNKWDLMAGKIKEGKYLVDIRQNLKELRDLAILCISGQTGHNCGGIFRIADELDRLTKTRISTSELNRFLGQLVGTHPAPDCQGRQVSLSYITQVESSPPVFVIFTNQPKGIEKSYRRYLTKKLCALIGGPKIPIILKFKSKI